MQIDFISGVPFPKCAMKLKKPAAAISRVPFPKRAMKLKKPAAATAAVTRRPSSDDVDGLVSALKPWVKLIWKIGMIWIIGVFQLYVFSQELT